MIVRLQLVNLLNGCDNRNENIEKLIVGSSASVETFSFTEQEKNLVSRGVGHINQIFALNSNSDAVTYFDNSNYAKSDKTPDLFFHNLNQIVDEADKSRIVDEATTTTQTHKILNKLLENADQNISRPKEGYRFDDDTKRFAAYLRMMCGPTLYNVLHRNLELALPSIVTVNKKIHSSNNINEGVLRCNELLLYLKEQNSPLVVGLSEDATRIEGRIQFDPKTNQLVGFVLPIISKNGLPSPHVYKANNIEDIVKCFANQTPVANNVSTIMAQPIANIPPFCLLVFGTDGRYNAKDVARRWIFISNELKKLNITVLSIASDSDPRFNSAMRANSLLGAETNLNEFGSIGDSDWFRCGGDFRPPFYFQDVNHIGTKLRNFFLKTFKLPKMLPLGPNQFILMQHLAYLYDHQRRDEHQLTATCLNPTDRQNFDSVLKICNPKITNLLRQYVKDSEATATFLDALHNFLESFTNISLSPLERLLNAWRSIFFFRLWREYVTRTKGLSLKENFLTMNCYSCLEQNAHSLVLVLLYLGKVGRPDLFLPFLFNSQPCEEFYRKIRSMTPTYSTVVNCSVKEFIARVHKTQLQSNISSINNSNYRFPKNLKSKDYSKIKQYQLPTPEEVFEVVQRAKNEAISIAAEFDLCNRAQSEIIPCRLSPHSFTNVKKKTIKLRCEQKVDVSTIINQLSTIRLTNYAEKFQGQSVEETSSFTEIPNSRRRIIVKKTSICWLLRDEMPKLSSDRNERVETKSVPLNIRIISKTDTIKNRKQRGKQLKMKVNHFRDILLLGKRKKGHFQRY